ncbi:MFS transporter [Providencia rettgeri]|uniref:MFS transporter n=1 Tax=Providencia TaxID=586 RepID=UPI00065DF204|nr:MFS transporter [Providencia rettgeri]EJD6044522.1 MFS transporter [Providencia rettgeri]EJD6045354.1 MFS transporter [Providencia rettgeri]ELR5127233.1 MFS transporter [Providencia rettgeri]ELR5178431.1 MFS transporter [Providencia rettgeri]ELR5179928.1 MFS transporter [Providencia rettgeri]
MSTITRLKIVSFMQFFIWGSWLVTFASYMFNTLHFTGGDVGLVFSSLGIASLCSPILMGLIADRINNRKFVYVTIHLISAFFLIAMAHSTSVSLLFAMTLVHLIFYMPTMSICNSIIFEILDREKLKSENYFPKIRVYGTVGFIAAMWIISLLKLEMSYYQLYIAAIASVALSLYSVIFISVNKDNHNLECAPHSFKFSDLAVLFRKSQVVVFLFFSMLLGSVLQITNTLGVPFLQDLAAAPEAQNSIFSTYPTIFLSISQFSEVIFILLLPFLLKYIKIEKVLLLSMIAWILRFGLFAYGDFTYIGTIALFLSMLVYGCAFDFFNISGSLFLEKEIAPEFRSTAQGVFTTLVNGFGTFLGAILSGWVLDLNTINGVVDWKMFWIVFTSYTITFTFIYVLYMFFSNRKKQHAYS